MDLKESVSALSALAQETRMQVFRLLIEKGHEGLPSSEIADAIGVRQNLMSTHLNILANAGLTDVRREGRRIFHAIDFEKVRSLFSYLIQDCCNGRAEACQPLLDEILILRDGTKTILEKRAEH